MLGVLKDFQLKKVLRCCRSDLKTIFGGSIKAQDVREIAGFELFSHMQKQCEQTGISEWGGLAWLSAQIVGDTLKKIQAGKVCDETLYDNADTMASVALAVFNNMPEYKLDQEDIELVEQAGILAIEWMDKSEEKEEREILHQLDLIKV